MRQAARLDANQGAIVGALIAAGASVQVLAQMGRGCPDLLVGFRGANLLLECKDGEKSPSRRKLTEDQQRWIRMWSGSVSVVLSPEDALRAIGAIA